MKKHSKSVLRKPCLNCNHNNILRKRHNHSKSGERSGTGTCTPDFYYGILGMRETWYDTLCKGATDSDCEVARNNVLNWGKKE